jgi:hypothetical protein
MSTIENASAAVADLIRRTRLDRGLPAIVTDASALGRVARLASKGAGR